MYKSFNVVGSIAMLLLSAYEGSAPALGTTIQGAAGGGKPVDAESPRSAVQLVMNFQDAEGDRRVVLGGGLIVGPHLVATVYCSTFLKVLLKVPGTFEIGHLR